MRAPSTAYVRGSRPWQAELRGGTWYVVHERSGKIRRIGPDTTTNRNNAILALREADRRNRR